MLLGILLDLRARPHPDSEQEQQIMLSIEDDFTGFERREGEDDGDGAAIVFHIINYDDERIYTRVIRNNQQFLGKNMGSIPEVSEDWYIDMPVDGLAKLRPLEGGKLSDEPQPNYEEWPSKRCQKGSHFDIRETLTVPPQGRGENTGKPGKGPEIAKILNIIMVCIIIVLLIICILGNLWVWLVKII